MNPPLHFLLIVQFKKKNYHYFHLFYMDIFHIFYMGKVLRLLYFYLHTVFVSGANDAPKKGMGKYVNQLYLISLGFWKEIKDIQLT